LQDVKTMDELKQLVERPAEEHPFTARLVLVKPIDTIRGVMDLAFRLRSVNLITSRLNDECDIRDDAWRAILRFHPTLEIVTPTAVNDMPRPVVSLRCDALLVANNHRTERRLYRAWASVYLAAMRALRRHPLRDSIFDVLKQGFTVFIIKEERLDAGALGRLRPPFEFDLDRARWQKLDRTLWAKRNGVVSTDVRPSEK
jgi:hypothetical protein